MVFVTFIVGVASANAVLSLFRCLSGISFWRYFSHRPIVASPSSKRGSVSVLGGSVLFVFMFSIFERVLEAKGAGWSLLRYALILGPAILALIVLNTAFRLD